MVSDNDPKVSLYVDDLIFSENNYFIFKEFKRTMTHEFEMTDIGHMSYFLEIEVKQTEEGISITQKGSAKEILNKFKINYCNSVRTPMRCGIRLSKNDESIC